MAAFTIGAALSHSPVLSAPTQTRGATSHESAVAGSPGSPRGDTAAAMRHVERGAALVREGKLAEAETELVEADRLRPEYSPGLIQLSNVRYRLGKKNEALADLERVIRKGTSFDDKAFLLASRIFSEQKEFLAGQKKLVEWGASRPVSANFHAAIGLLKLGGHELGQSELELRKALKLDPSNDAALGGMFQLYARFDQYAKLQPILDKGLEARPKSLGLLMLSGNSLMRQERWAEAKDRFDRALAVDPSNAAALANRASARHRLGETVVESHERAVPRRLRAREEAVPGPVPLAAIEDYRRSMEMDPKGIEAPVNLATVLESQGKFAEARDVLLAARKRGITDLDVLNALSVAYDLNGETDLAIAAARESLERNPAQEIMQKQLVKLEAKKNAPSNPAASPPSRPASVPPTKER